MPLLPDFSSGKEMKENGLGGGATKKHVFQLKLEEAQKLLEDQHLSGLQKFCHEVNRITSSETLSSVDSLEAGGPEEPAASAPRSSDLRSAQLACTQALPSSTARRISNWLANVGAPSVQNDEPFSDLSGQPPARPSEESAGGRGPRKPALHGAVERTADPAGSPVGSACACGPGPRRSASVTSATSTALKPERPLVAKSPSLPLRRAWSPTDSPPREVAVLAEPALAPAAAPPRAHSARTWPQQRGHAEEASPGRRACELGARDAGDEEGKCSDVPQAAGAPRGPDPAAGVVSNRDAGAQHGKAKHGVRERSGMRLLKSILKKESKHEHDCLRALVLSQGFTLGNKKAAAIRDSVELTKERGERAALLPKTVKKLRWLDETGSAETEAGGSEPRRNGLELAPAPFDAETGSAAAAGVVRAPARTVSLAQRPTPGDESVAGVGGSGTEPAPLKCFVPLGSDWAEESGLAPGGEGSPAPAPKAGPGSQKVGLPRGAASVARRTRSAKGPSGYVHTSRKGAVVRPQSASKAKTFLQAQSQLIIPHPPPQPPSDVGSGKTSPVSPCPSATPEGSQSTVARGFRSKHLLPAEQELSQWNRRRGLPFSNIRSELVAGMPSPPSCSNCQTSATMNHLSGTQKGGQGDEPFCCTHRCPDYEETQPVNKWKRQHNSLGQNGKAAEPTATRRKRITENKRGILLEQKRQNPGAAAQRFRGQHVGQTIQLSSSEPKPTATGTSVEQVSESTSEFLMAEDLVKASVAEDDVLSALQSRQEWKLAPSSEETRQFNLCTLSAEEQEILWSLEHLDERLHYLQEIICKNPSIKNTFKIIPALNSHPRAIVSPDGGSRPRREYW